MVEPTLQSFKEAGDTVLKKVYVNYRAPFVNFARKFQLSEDEILDIYQDAIIVLRENIQSGKIEELNSSIKTYLFSIGKYKIYTHLRENNKMRVVDEQQIEEEAQDFDLDLGSERLTEKQTILKKSLEKMGGKCKLILELFYYHGLTIDEIRISENYENNNTVRSQKSRCLKTLKNMILNPEQ